MFINFVKLFASTSFTNFSKLAIVSSFSSIKLSCIFVKCCVVHFYFDKSCACFHSIFLNTHYADFCEETVTHTLFPFKNNRYCVSELFLHNKQATKRDDTKLRERQAPILSHEKLNKSTHCNFIIITIVIATNMLPNSLPSNYADCITFFCGGLLVISFWNAVLDYTKLSVASTFRRFQVMLLSILLFFVSGMVTVYLKLFIVTTATNNKARIWEFLFAITCFVVKIPYYVSAFTVAVLNENELFAFSVDVVVTSLFVVTVLMVIWGLVKNR